MGLSGVILNVTLQLKAIESAWIRQQTIRASRLSELMEAFESDEQWTYSVVWVDSLAEAMHRGMLMRGEHATEEQVQKSIIFGGFAEEVTCAFLFAEWSIESRNDEAFNSVYYHQNQQPVKERLVHYESFFYPLDAIGNWNRIYGRRGFMQYQFVLPRATGQWGLKRF